jgi:hypothetical protein
LDDDANGKVEAAQGAVLSNDCSVLRSVKVELEDDPVCCVELGAAFASEQRAKLLHVGSVTHEYRTGQDRTVAGSVHGRHLL